MSTIGMSGVSKAYLIERVTRTLQERLAYSIDNITNSEEYFKEILFLVNQYNNTWEHSAISSTPKKFLNTPKLNPVWGKTSFSYYRNKIEVDQKMLEIEKQVPIMSPVRVFEPIRTQVVSLFNKRPKEMIILFLQKKETKRSHTSSWSREVKNTICTGQSSSCAAI